MQGCLQGHSHSYEHAPADLKRACSHALRGMPRLLPRQTMQDISQTTPWLNSSKRRLGLCVCVPGCSGGNCGCSCCCGASRGGGFHNCCPWWTPTLNKCSALWLLIYDQSRHAVISYLVDLFCTRNQLPAKALQVLFIWIILIQKPFGFP